MNIYICIKKYTLLLLAIVVLAGCKKEKIEEAEEQPLQEGSSMSVNVEARFELPDNLQKSYLKDDMVEWEDGDQIRLNNDVLTIHRHEGGVGYFQGNATAYTNPSTYYNEWFAVYPKELAASGSLLKSGSRQIHVNIPQTQYYQEVDETNSKYLKDMNYMIAYTTASNNGSISLQFVNLCAVLKIGLKKGPTSGHGAHLVSTPNTQNAKVKKIVLYTSHSTAAAFWGDGYVNSGNNTALANVTDNLASLPSIQIEVGGATNNNRKMILDCTQDKNGNQINNGNGVTLTNSTKWFYIMVPINLTGKKLNDMCIEVYDGNGNMMKKILKGKSIERNKIYTSDLGSLQCQYSANSFIDADFSVDAKHTVKFTSGNLQFWANSSNRHWRFAPNQYDVIGNANTNISSSYSGYIDLFGYGTSGSTCQPWYYAAVEGDYPSKHISKKESDWGWYNNIGGHPKQVFFTWTKDHVVYLFKTRSASTVRGKDDARYAMARVHNGSNYVNGVILFPDIYTHPNNVGDPKNINYRDIEGDVTIGTQAEFSDMSYNLQQWNAMENAGAVFLPCGGQRNLQNMYLAYTNNGDYWVSSSETTGSGTGWHLYTAYQKRTGLSSYAFKRHGRSVRLILSNY
ncbi:MAG: hypothetical protein J6X35_07375 [Bacteroidales bacterium]|nr:hypothetical protein [Bacteroidales bacterium]